MLSRMRGWVERLGPYQSLFLLAVPTSIVEPLKLVAIAVAGDGHWITGLFVIVAAYAASLLLVERLFAIVKPRLMTLNWFARLWSWLRAVVKQSKTIKEGISRRMTSVRRVWC